jgi:RNA polymerase sigma-70 factor (ECF subfamily)
LLWTEWHVGQGNRLGIRARLAAVPTPLDTATDPADRQLAQQLQSLVLEMGRGRQLALEQFYAATVARVHALAMAILRDPQDAEEVVCDTYTQAWSAAASYDPQRANAFGWLVMICRSRALDRLRRRRSARRDALVPLEAIAEFADEADGPQDLLERVEAGGRVHAALASLGPQQRRLVGLAFLRGLSHREIAEVTELPLGTVKSHVRRALAELRAALGE